MTAVDVSYCIGGEAGQGVESSGAGFCQALTHAGLHVFGLPSYYSRIRGGHNFFTIRASDAPVSSLRESIQVLMALNAETIERHIDAMAPGGVIIADEGIEPAEGTFDGRDVHHVAAPLVAIAERHGNRVMTNTALLAVAAALTGLDVEIIVAVIRRNFAAKSARIADSNEAVAREAYAWAHESGHPTEWALPAGDDIERFAINGNEAFAMGAVMAGCKFVAGYPMTPATSVLVYAAQHADDWGLVVKHAEDEISAVNMCIGAAHMGVRAMAPTSGGGFDLMAEGLSLSGITETPLVIYLAQRPGPGTGLATRTAQADLNLALYSGHGEFPRAVLAPRSPQEAFECAARAFNLAEAYQCLVIVLSDHDLATDVVSTETSAMSVNRVPIERGELMSPDALDALEDEYLRYKITPSGVSPRALPGSHPKAVYLATANEHLENGHITEEPGISAAMVAKRTRKLEAMRADIEPPKRYGPENAATTLVSWGSTFGAAREAMENLAARGESVNLVHFCDLWPFPADEAIQVLDPAEQLVVVEGNAIGQFADLLHAQTGLTVHRRVVKYDGRGFSPEFILAALEE